MQRDGGLVKREGGLVERGGGLNKGFEKTRKSISIGLLDFICKSYDL